MASYIWLLQDPHHLSSLGTVSFSLPPEANLHSGFRDIITKEYYVSLTITSEATYAVSLFTEEQFCQQDCWNPIVI